MSSTIKDVGRLAGVSIATVSRVVNGAGGVSDENRTKVLNAISKLQYRSNTHAAELGRAKGGGSLQSRAHMGASAAKGVKPHSFPESVPPKAHRHRGGSRFLEDEHTRMSHVVANLSEDLEKLSKDLKKLSEDLENLRDVIG